MSEHTANLRETGRAGLMLIEDEARTSQLFARNRLTLKGAVRHLPRDSAEWEAAARVYRERFGKFFNQLSQLRDFHMFCFKPQEARLVVGFGAAFQIGLPDWTALELLTGS